MIDYKLFIWLPWYIMIIASMVEIADHGVQIYYGVNRARNAWRVVSLLFLIVVWVLFVVTSGPDPFVNRVAAAAYIRLFALIGGVLWLAVGIVKLATNTRAWQLFKVRRVEKSEAL